MSIRSWPQFSATRLMSRRRRGVTWSAAHTCRSLASVTCALLERAMSGCRSTTYRESTQPFSSEDAVVYDHVPGNNFFNTLGNITSDHAYPPRNPHDFSSPYPFHRTHVLRVGRPLHGHSNVNR